MYDTHCIHMVYTKITHSLYDTHCIHMVRYLTGRGVYRHPSLYNTRRVYIYGVSYREERVCIPELPAG